MKLDRQSAYNKWFQETLNVPQANMSLYMRKLIKSAFFDAWDMVEENSGMLRERYQKGYAAGLMARNRKKTKPDS